MDETSYKMIKHGLGLCTSWDSFEELQEIEETERRLRTND